MAANSAAFARGSGHYLDSAVAHIVEEMEDTVEQNGVVVDRLALSRNFLSAKLIVIGTFVLDENETVTFSANARSADNTGMTTNVADLRQAPDLSDQFVPAQVIATGGSGGSTETVRVELDLDISGARRYLQCQFTCTVSDIGTGTVGAIWVFGGGDGHDDLT